MSGARLAAAAAACLRAAAPARAQADRFEPNQTRRTASPVEPGRYEKLRCDGEDWYVVEVPTGQRLVAHVALREGGDPAQDLDLEVQDRRGRALAWSRGRGRDEAAAVSAEPGPTFVRVHGGQTEYDLRLELEADAVAALGGGLAGEAVCVGNDFYRLEVEASHLVKIELGFDPAEGELALQLLDERQAELAAATGKGGAEACSWTAARATSALLHVRSPDGRRVRYRLRVAAGPSTLPDLDRAFGVERPQGAGEDRVELRSGDVLAGRVLDEGFRLVTSHADLVLSRARLAGLDLERRQGLDAALTVDEDLHRGFIRAEGIRLEMRGMPGPIVVPLARVAKVVFGRRGDERRPTGEGARAHVVLLAGGERFHGRLVGPPLEVDLGFATLPCELGPFVSIAFEGEGVVDAVRPDGSILRGRVRAEWFDLELDAGDEAPVRLRLHRDRISVIRIAGDGDAVGPAELMQALRRLAPGAPRDLVRELTKPGGATPDRVRRLEPHVPFGEEGCAPLRRHLVSGKAQPEARWAWLKLLLRVDGPLRGSLVAVVGDAAEDRRLRTIAALALVELVAEGGPADPVERAAQGEGADVMMPVVMNNRSDVLMQKLMPLFRGGFRGGRYEAPTDADRTALVEALPRLLEPR